MINPIYGLIFQILGLSPRFDVSTSTGWISETLIQRKRFTTGELPYIICGLKMTDSTNGLRRWGPFKCPTICLWQWRNSCLSDHDPPRSHSRESANQPSTMDWVLEIACQIMAMASTILIGNFLLGYIEASHRGSMVTRRRCSSCRRLHRHLPGCNCFQEVCNLT